MECVFGKINFYIWTFFNLFPTFFFILFFVSTCRIFFGQIKLSFMLQLLWKAFWNFSFTTASFNAPKGVCVWLESFGNHWFYAFNELFWYRIWSNYVQFQTSVEKSDEEAFSHPLSSSRRCNKLWGRCCTSGFSWGGGAIWWHFVTKFPFFWKKIIKFFL